MVKEKNGYLYPVCEQAAAVLDVLRYELQALGVEIQYQCKITKVENWPPESCRSVTEKRHGSSMRRL